MLIFKTLILGLISITNVYSVQVSFGDITEILSLGRSSVLSLLEALELLKNSGSVSPENEIPYLKRSEREFQKRIRELSLKIDAFEERSVIRTNAAVQTILSKMPKQIVLDRQMEQLDGYIAQINDLYALFTVYSTSPEHYEKITLEDFARTCVTSNSNGLPHSLKALHQMLVPSSFSVYNNSLLLNLANNMQVSELQCSESQSPQQLIYNLYRAIALTEIKGYSMIQFSYLILRTYNPGTNFTHEMEMVAQDYTSRTVQTLEAVKTAMASAPRELWRCDPEQHVLDETYTELNQLFQGYIINEVDLNPDATCWDNCGYYEYTKVYGCYQNQFCAQQRRCNGKVINCQFVASDFWICPSSKKGDRRYQYIEYEDGRVYGKKDVCPAATTKVDSWWRWLFWHCSYCFCYCDDHHNKSHRYFSLREVVADVTKNKIQEGELTTGGAIIQDSVAWKSIDQFSILDSDVKNGVDYHTLAWEKRALDLDDLTGNQNQLLTGVRFRVVGSRLNLEIRLTPFNFTSGKLDQPLEKSFWHSNDITDRKELLLQKPDIPIRPYFKHRPDTSVNQYINFAASDREKDAAQSTVPFLDMQPVESKPALPMSGAGIFHKGTPGSAGFIAMKLITFNFAPHLQVALPPTSS